MGRLRLARHASWLILSMFLLSLVAVSVHHTRAYQEGPKQKCAICKIADDLQGLSSGEVATAVSLPGAEPAPFPLPAGLPQPLRPIRVGSPRAPPQSPSVCC